MSAARVDAASGTEALRALEGRCIEAEKRVEQLTLELSHMNSRAFEADIDKREVGVRYERSQVELEKMEDAMRALQQEEK